MSEPLHLTIVYEPGDEGWVVASVPEVPGALSQGRTREEARGNVIDALRGILELRFGEHALTEPAADIEGLGLELKWRPPPKYLERPSRKDSGGTLRLSTRSS
jgi:predicted RNase H-like HicB family nuclease